MRTVAAIVAMQHGVPGRATFWCASPCSSGVRCRSRLGVAACGNMQVLFVFLIQDVVPIVLTLFHIRGSPATQRE